MGEVLVREVEMADEAAWRALWQGYNDFYGAAVPPVVTAATWRRILDPASPVFGRLAVLDGQPAGLCHLVLHDGTWTLTPTCYLEDLFVAPTARGAGLGRRLVRDALDLARARGWSRVYWHTRRDNPARRLYDEFGPADDFVRYRVMLNEA